VIKLKNREKNNLLILIVFTIATFFYFPRIILAKTTADSNINANVNAATANVNVNNNVDQTKKQAEIQQKQEQLNSVRTQINSYEKRSDILEQKTDTIQRLLGALDNEIKEAEEALQKTQREIDGVQRSLNDKENEIVVKEDDIEKRKKFLEEYMRKLDSLDKKSMVEVILEKPSFAEYFREMEDVVVFQEHLWELLASLNTDRNNLLKEKTAIEETKNEQMALYSMQDEQRIELDRDKKDREDLLAETQLEQNKIGDLVEKGTTVANRLTAEITALQSCGTKLDFGQALTEAKVVAQLTGVRAAFLLGVLKVESNMGNNVGGGTYKTDMNPAQWDRFKNICSEIGYEPSDKPVSRKPCYRNSKGDCTGWGGAMGPAQFMPSTWMGYKAEVAKVTGHNPPDPWNLRDALTAMGLKLAKVSGVTSHDRQAEHKAASIYLAGGNWERFGWYGDRVLKFADAYEGQVQGN